jgi:uncharacterized protein YcbX
VIHGVLGGLARWPVKSMAGERLRAARLDGRGLGGDRTHALLDAGDGRPLTAARAPRLLAWAAAYPDAPAFAEERWQGGRLQVGEVTLHLLHPCARCVIPSRHPDGAGGRWPALLRHLHRARAGLFGINARVLHPGRVALGDHATVAPP